MVPDSHFGGGGLASLDSVTGRKILHRHTVEIMLLHSHLRPGLFLLGFYPDTCTCTYSCIWYGRTRWSTWVLAGDGVSEASGREPRPSSVWFKESAGHGWFSQMRPPGINSTKKKCCLRDEVSETKMLCQDFGFQMEACFWEKVSYILAERHILKFGTFKRGIDTCLYTTKIRRIFLVEKCGIPWKTVH